MFQKSLIDNDHFQAIDQLVNSIQEDQLGHVAENVTK
jgi:hypothetical protein